VLSVETLETDESVEFASAVRLAGVISAVAGSLPVLTGRLFTDSDCEFGVTLFEFNSAKVMELIEFFSVLSPESYLLNGTV
jgi:hypothetical protein